MKVITVRNSDGVLVCFGPDNGYAPNVPVGHTLAVEPDYESVLAEYSPPPKVADADQQRLVTLTARLLALETAVSAYDQRLAELGARVTVLDDPLARSIG